MLACIDHGERLQHAPCNQEMLPLSNQQHCILKILRMWVRQMFVAMPAHYDEPDLADLSLSKDMMLSKEARNDTLEWAISHVCMQAWVPWRGVWWLAACAVAGLASCLMKLSKDGSHQQIPHQSLREGCQAFWHDRTSHPSTYSLLPEGS